MNQYTKNLAPGTGPRNKETHNHFAAMEKKLKEMQESLALIDRELEEEEACKQVKKIIKLLYFLMKQGPFEVVVTNATGAETWCLIPGPSYVAQALLCLFALRGFVV